jgi:glycosyltransferase involved in cell wall biosynthesis
MKKVLIAITKGEIGGAQMFVRNLATGLKKNGLQITVILGSKHSDFLESEMAKAGIPIHTFYNLSRSFSPLRNFFLILEAKRYLDKNLFDAVQLNSSNTLFIALAAKLSKSKPRVIFTHHGLSFLDPSSTKKIKRCLAGIVFKLLLPFVDLNVFVSQKNLSDALAIKLVKKENSLVIYNSVNVDFKSKIESLRFLESELGVSLKNKFIFGSIGRLAHPKNYEFLISCVPSIIDQIQNTKYEIRFILIGDGPDKSKYQELIAKNNLENYFYLTGEIKEAARYIKAFDLFVLPSVYEGSSLTAIEAISADLPILISRVGGNPELVDGNNAQLFELDSQKEFTDKAMAIIRDKKLYQKLALQNKKISQRFSRKIILEKYLSIFKN